MGHMKSDERYDAKEAYNKNLSSKARMHYLENNIADRKGHSGTYSGNHPRYSKGMSMMGQAKADLAYNPVDDIAGQGTEGVNTGMMMKNMSPMQNMNKGYGQQVGKPSVASKYDKVVLGGNINDKSKTKPGKKDYAK